MTTDAAGKIFRVSLTTFVDFVIAPRVKKLAVVKRALDQSDRGYSRSSDYYRGYRHTLRQLLEAGRPVAELGPAVAAAADAKKVVNFDYLARGFERCWATHFQENGYVWVEPPRSEWYADGLRLSINPELAFTDGTKAVFLKLYLKKDEPDRESINLVLHLLQLGLAHCLRGASVAVMDVRRARLYEASSFDERLTTWLRGEAASFAAIYRILSDERRAETIGPATSNI